MKRVREDDQDDLELAIVVGHYLRNRKKRARMKLLAATALILPVPRSPALFRKRWDSIYLVNLAINESKVRHLSNDTFVCNFSTIQTKY